MRGGLTRQESVGDSCPALRVARRRTPTVWEVGEVGEAVIQILASKPAHTQSPPRKQGLAVTAVSPAELLRRKRAEWIVKVLGELTAHVTLRRAKRREHTVSPSQNKTMEEIVHTLMETRAPETAT